MSETKTTYRERVYQRPVFKRRHIEVIGDNLPPNNSFLFEDIVLIDRHKVEDITVTVKRTTEPYDGQDKPESGSK